MRRPIYFRTPSEDDIVHVAQNMRAIDALECQLVHGGDPEPALRDSIARSDWALAGLAGEPLQAHCIFGVAPDDTTLLGEGFAWLLGTESLIRYARELLERSPFYVEAMLSGYERLRNIVHADNAASIRWLQRLGFLFSEAIDVKGHSFLPFELGRP